jgi:hypothetical protein
LHEAEEVLPQDGFSDEMSMGFEFSAIVGLSFPELTDEDGSGDQPAA